VSGTENGTERAEKSAEQSGAVSGSGKNQAERSVEREVVERKRSGERAKFLAHAGVLNPNCLAASVINTSRLTSIVSSLLSLAVNDNE